MPIPDGHYENLTPAEREYNHRFSKMRTIVECSIGLLKNKWRILTNVIHANHENSTKVKSINKRSRGKGKSTFSDMKKIS